MFPLWSALPTRGGSFVFSEMWVVPFCSLYFSFLGCFGVFFFFLWNGWQGFHDFLAIFPQKEKDWYDVEHTSLKGMMKRKKESLLHLNGLGQSPKFLRYIELLSGCCLDSDTVVKKESSKCHKNSCNNCCCAVLQQNVGRVQGWNPRCFILIDIALGMDMKGYQPGYQYMLW